MPASPGKGQLSPGDGSPARTPLRPLAWSDLDRAVRSAQNWGRPAEPGEQAPDPGSRVLLASPEPATGSEPGVAAGTTFAADLAGHVLTWAERRSLGLSSACGISLALAACAATWLSAGTRADNACGAAALGAGYLIFLAGRHQGEIGRAGHLADAGRCRWLTTLTARAFECVIYAGLAAGSASGQRPGQWTLGIAVLGLAGVRDMMTACSDPPGLGRGSETPQRRLALAAVTMPPGGRMLVVVLIGPAWGARAVLLALLTWAILAIADGIAGRAVAAMQANPATLVRLRDDGALARALGALVRGNLLPLPPAILSVAAMWVLVLIGLRGLPGVLLVGPAIVMLLAAPGSSHRHSGRLDWLVPALLLGAQLLYLSAVGLAVAVAGPVVFVLCAALLLHYSDLAVTGQRQVSAGPAEPAFAAVAPAPVAGWDGRLLLAGVAAALGIASYAYLALAAYMAVLIGRRAAHGLREPRPGTR